jgi:hypothetical protein
MGDEGEGLKVRGRPSPPWVRASERTDRDVVSVRIPEGELPCLRVRVHVRLLVEPGDESACPRQGPVEVVDAEEQEQPVARWRRGRTHQGRMLVRAPLVKAEQDGSIRIQDLCEVVVARRRLGLAEEGLVPFAAGRDIADANDRPCAFHRMSAVTYLRPNRSATAGFAETARFTTRLLFASLAPFA